MADLDPAHVEAVARAIDPIPFVTMATSVGWEHYRGLARSHATDLLTSTDPAVHAALLAVPAVREALANAWDEGYHAWPSAAGKAGNHYRYGNPPTGDVDA